jgi:poly(3-hydroxybutyrate) depolymerase
VLALIGAGALYLVLAATILAPVDKHGARLVQLEIHSRAVGRELGLNVIVPKDPGPRGQRSLVVMLHGRGGDEDTFNDVVFEGLGDLHGRRAPIFAFPSGGVHGYWHDRADGNWG